MSLLAEAGFLGEQLIKMGAVTGQEILHALEVQADKRRNGQKVMLGQVLVELGYCREEVIAQALAKKSGFQFLSINNTGIDMACANLITPEVAAKYKLIPVAVANGKLQVAMQNPNDIIAIDDIQLLTGYEVEPIVVPDRELSAIIEQFRNMSRNVQTKVEEDKTEAEDPTSMMELNYDQPAVLLVNQILNYAVRTRASDIHIEPQERNTRIRFRIDGVLHEMMQQPIKIHPMLVSRVKVMAGMDIAERRVPQDGRITTKVEEKVFDIRVASLPSAYGEKITMRLLDRESEMLTLEQLGFSDQQLVRYNEVMKLPYGFILITGPTGSGKSTTMYATLARLNKTDKNIITLEDPVERRMGGLNQIQINPKAGITFASGLRSILRNDPDIIMVGEIRDQETAKIAVESALTGHLVLSTLHTNDAPGAVSRLVEMGVETFLTASSLAGVLAQRLVRVLCPVCKKPYRIGREELLTKVPDFPLAPGEDEVVLHRPEGCLSCNNTGYRGRTGVYEFLRITEYMQTLIVNKASTNEIRAAAIGEGMQTLRQDCLLKVRRGLTSLEELVRVIV